MKTYILSATAVAFSLALIMPASAQQVVQAQVQAGETALEFAQRVNACGGADILDAAFIDAGSALEVQCSPLAATAETAGMTGGLGTAAAIGGGVVVLALALGGGGGGSDGGIIPPSSTPSTSGTN